jgi:fatty acid desaturase
VGSSPISPSDPWVKTHPALCIFRMAPKGESASASPSVVKAAPASRSWGPDEGTSCSAPINFFGGTSPSLAPPPLLTDAKLTRQAIKDRLPARLFERSAFWGFVHLAWDLTMIGAGVYGATHIELVESPVARAALWLLFWLFNGAVMTGVWVLAHECGHQSFSDSEWLNNSVGWVLHSALLVPFHSWRISHRNHHSNTCSIEHDEVFVPSTRSDFSEMIADTPLYNAFEIFLMLTFGW